MILYHGSYLSIDQIDLTKSMKGKDFGQGFYLSADIEQAKNIAKIRSLSVKKSPVVNVYEIKDDIISGTRLKIKRYEDYSLEWVKFVLANRNNKSDSPIHDYDIVIGPIANDNVGQQIRRFTEGEITIEEFLERLKYMKGVTIQYFFGTEQSIRHLTKIDALEI